MDDIDVVWCRSADRGTGGRAASGTRSGFVRGVRGQVRWEIGVRLGLELMRFASFRLRLGAFG